MAGTSASSAALTARRLLRSLDRAALATSLAPASGGGPYVSLVLAATAPDGAPLLLISDLAQHTINLKRDPAVSLLLDGTAGLDEPLTGPRLTLLGGAARAADTALLARFVARHPSASSAIDTEVRMLRSSSTRAMVLGTEILLVGHALG